LRIQLELPEEDVREIKALMEKARIDSYKDLFSNALTLLHWVVQEVSAGRTIASLDEANGRYKELAMPILNTVARAAAKARESEARVG
jgi:hypothetical protein